MSESTLAAISGRNFVPNLCGSADLPQATQLSDFFPQDSHYLCKYPWEQLKFTQLQKLSLGQYCAFVARGVLQLEPEDTYIALETSVKWCGISKPPHTNTIDRFAFISGDL